MAMDWPWLFDASDPVSAKDDLSHEDAFALLVHQMK
jgi:hypothetical protein